MDLGGYYSYYYSQFPEQSSATYPSTSTTQYSNYQNELHIFLNEIWPSEEQEGNPADSIPLPGELTKLFKPLECGLCGVKVNTEVSAFTHYEGKVHIKNVNAFMKQHYKIQGSLKIIKERFAPVVCEFCNIELTSKLVYQQHINGKQHLKNLSKMQYPIQNFQTEEGEESLPPPPTPPSLANFICEICNISTNTEIQMFTHKSGKKHMKRLNKLQQLHLDSAVDDFYNGEWPQGSENGHFMQNSEYENDNTIVRDFVDDPNMDYPLEFNKLSAEDCDNSPLIDSQLEAENEKQFSQISEDCVQSRLEDKQEEQFTQISEDSLPSQLEDKTEKQLTQKTPDANLSLIGKAENESSTEFINENINSPQVQNKIKETDISTEHFISQTDEISTDVSVANSDKCNEGYKNSSNIASSSFNCEAESVCIDKKLSNETQSMEENKLNEQTSDQQELTNLAIKEIIRESNAFIRERNFGTYSTCKYDIAGFRIKEKVSDNKSDGVFSKRKIYFPRNKYGNNKYNYNMNNYYSNYKSWNNLNRNRKWKYNYNYGYNYNTNIYQYRNSYNQDNRYYKRYYNSKTNRKYNSDYKRKRKRSSSQNYSNDSDRSRNSGRHYKKTYRQNNNRSRDKRSCRSSRTDSCCRTRCDKCSCTSSSRSSSSNESSASSTENFDYSVDKDGYCEKRHRSELAYSACPNKHRKRNKEIKKEMKH